MEDTTTAPEVSTAPDAGAVTEAAPWYGELPEDLAESKSYFDQFKDRDSFFKSAKETKAALSRKLEGYVKLPGEGSTPEEIAAYRQAVGVPDSPDGYEVQIEGLPEGMAWDPEALAPFKELAAAEGIPAKAFAALVQKQAEVEAQLFAAQQEQIQQANQALVNEWGDSYDFKLGDISQRVGDVLDLNQPFLSTPDVLRALDKLAKDFREDDTRPGNTASTSAVAARERIEAIRNDPAYTNVLDPRHKEVRAEMHRLLMAS
jgi:hypothetical protein